MQIRKHFLSNYIFVLDLKAMRAPRVIVKLPEDFNPEEAFEFETLHRAVDPAVLLVDEDKTENITQPSITSNNIHTTIETNNLKEEKDAKKDHHLTKRQSKRKMQIETAVFVDNAMYDVLQDQNPNGDTIQDVTDTVFAIMNGVSLFFSYFSFIFVCLKLLLFSFRNVLKSKFNYFS